MHDVRMVHNTLLSHSAKLMHDILFEKDLEKALGTLAGSLEAALASTSLQNPSCFCSCT